MDIQKIDAPTIHRYGVIPASEYFPYDVPGWILVCQAGVMYYPPDEWEEKAAYKTIHILEEDWEYFAEGIDWDENHQGGVLKTDDDDEIRFVLELPS